MNNNTRTPRPKITTPPPPPPRTPQWISENFRQEGIVAQRQLLNSAVAEYASTIGARRPASARNMVHAYSRVDEPLGKLLGMLTRDELAETLASVLHGVISIAYREGLDQ